MVGLLRVVQAELSHDDPQRNVRVSLTYWNSYPETKLDLVALTSSVFGKIKLMRKWQEEA